MPLYTIDISLVGFLLLQHHLIWRAYLLDGHNDWPQWEQSRVPRAVWSRSAKMKPLDYDMPWQRLWWTFAASWVTENKNLEELTNLLSSVSLNMRIQSSPAPLAMRAFNLEDTTPIQKFPQTWSLDLSTFYADPKSSWALLQWPGIFWRFHSDRIQATAWGTTTVWSVMSYFWSSIHLRSLHIFQRFILQKTLSYTHLFQKINKNKINTDKYKTLGN